MQVLTGYSDPAIFWFYFVFRWGNFGPQLLSALPVIFLVTRDLWMVPHLIQMSLSVSLVKQRSPVPKTFTKLENNFLEARYIHTTCSSLTSCMDCLNMSFKVGLLDEFQVTIVAWIRLFSFMNKLMPFQFRFLIESSQTDITRKRFFTMTNFMCL